MSDVVAQHVARDHWNASLGLHSLFSCARGLGEQRADEVHAEPNPG
jgi:hypothetical protein